jgi:hypothetical protein
MIAILDVDSIAYACGNPNKVLDANNQPIKVLSEKGNMVFQYVDKTEEELKQSCDFVMTEILNTCGCDSYIGYVKGKGTITDRLTINPDYKQNRSKEQPKWWQLVTDYLWSNWNCTPVNGMEVDDAVNITRLQLPDSFIVAIDGDLLGLEGTHFNWRTKEWLTINRDQAVSKFWKDMIVGQSGDNIKGIPNKGIKFWEDQYKNIFFADDFRTHVLEDYVRYLGEYQGIKEFYKNYISLKILDSKEGFVIPEPITWKKKELINTEELFN